MTTFGHQPTHGFTKLGQAVHRRTIDHLPTRTSYDRFNKRLALWITGNVGTMTCFWLFCLISLTCLPAVLVAAHAIQPSWVGFLAATGFNLIVIWIAQTFFQFVLLPAIIVGQNLQNEAADARAAKMFEDVESARECVVKALDLLDVHTEGGLKVVLDAVESLKTPSAS
jgi:fucose 4-O-acetylase-like acetyltransferase